MTAPTDLCLSKNFYNRQQLQEVIESIHFANPGCKWHCTREMNGDSPVSETWFANNSPVVEYRWFDGGMDVNDLRSGDEK